MSQLSPSVQAVLELFQGPLADLRFADVDAAGLLNLASEVEQSAAAVAEQEALLSELRQTLADRQDSLLLLAQRALAYARVYAEHDDALSEQLARIALPRAGKPRKANAKAASAEQSATSAEQSATSAEQSATSAEQSATSAEQSADSQAEVAAEGATDAGPETSAIDVAELPAEAPRKGKRRANASAGEQQSRPV